MHPARPVALHLDGDVDPLRVGAVSQMEGRLAGEDRLGEEGRVGGRERAVGGDRQGMAADLEDDLGWAGVEVVGS